MLEFLNKWYKRKAIFRACAVTNKKGEIKEHQAFTSGTASPAVCLGQKCYSQEMRPFPSQSESAVSDNKSLLLNQLH